jgi:hypothetical protein
METMEQYRGFTIEPDGMNPFGSVQFMWYPTAEGRQDDADYTGDRYKYTGNCVWSDSLEEAKVDIDDYIIEQQGKRITELEFALKHATDWIKEMHGETHDTKIYTSVLTH